MKYIQEFISFFRNISQDPRIPVLDKKLIFLVLVLIIFPNHLIFDWPPLLGLLFNYFLIGIVLDYFFNHLDREMLLSHFPWSLKSFIQFKNFASLFTFCIPGWIKGKIWIYKPSVYKNI